MPCGKTIKKQSKKRKKMIIKNDYFLLCRIIIFYFCIVKKLEKRGILIEVQKNKIMERLFNLKIKKEQMGAGTGEKEIIRHIFKRLVEIIFFVM